MKEIASINGTTLCIENVVINDLVQYQKTNSFAIENGGILIGLLNPAEKQIIITDFTKATESDHQSQFYFKRSEKKHQQKMDELWERSGNKKTYLGEWHTHNQDDPIPSTTDINSWIRISKKAHNSPLIFFMILGKKTLRIWIIDNEKHVLLTSL